MATLTEIREAAERSLVTFIKLVAPQRVLGNCHDYWLEEHWPEGIRS